MAFMLGSFTDGLFGGVASMLELGNSVEKLRTIQKWNEAAAATRAAMEEDAAKTGKAGDTGDKAARPAQEYVEPPAKTAYKSFDEDPELASLPPSKAASTALAGTNYLPPQTKSATAADESNSGGSYNLTLAGKLRRAESPYGDPTTATKSATAADQEAAQYPAGALGFSLMRGAHRTTAGEPGIASYLPSMPDIRWSPSRGLYREGSAITQGQPYQQQPQQQQPASAPSQPGGALGMYLLPDRNVQSGPPQMLGSAGLDFQQPSSGGILGNLLPSRNVPVGGLPAASIGQQILDALNRQ